MARVRVEKYLDDSRNLFRKRAISSQYDVSGEISRFSCEGLGIYETRHYSGIRGVTRGPSRLRVKHEEVPFGISKHENLVAGYILVNGERIDFGNY